MAVYYVYFLGSIPTRLLPSQDVNEVWYLTDQHLTKDRWLICFFIFTRTMLEVGHLNYLPDTSRHQCEPPCPRLPSDPWGFILDDWPFQHILISHIWKPGGILRSEPISCVFYQKKTMIAEPTALCIAVWKCVTPHFFQICLDHLKSFFFWYDFHAN